MITYTSTRRDSGGYRKTQKREKEEKISQKEEIYIPSEKECRDRIMKEREAKTKGKKEERRGEVDNIRGLTGRVGNREGSCLVFMFCQEISVNERLSVGLWILWSV